MKDKPRIAATVECRMGSSRLPGKVLMRACGKPMLELLAERLAKIPQVDAIVLATTTAPGDDPIVELAGKLGLACFRGSEEDVLSRVLGAARSAEADLILEITGDCPLNDPEIAGQVIDLYLRNDCDYASNVDPLTFPIGMDAQVFSTELLALADREGQTQEDREHVSWFIRKNPERFRKLHLPAPLTLHWPELAVTLDEKEDFELIKRIFEELYPKDPDFSCYDILRLLREKPELLEINKNIVRKEPEA